MELCSQTGVSVAFYSDQGRFLARVQGAVSGNVMLRREQYRRADSMVASATLARAMLTGKIANCRNVLLRSARERPEGDSRTGLTSAATDLGHLIKRLQKEEDLDAMRGTEGDAARTYFGVFNHLIVCQSDDFCFHERSRRPPLDNLNALLSFTYTLVAHDVASALEGVGLDPAVGYLHRDRPGRAGLALDIMEEFRPYLADRLVLSLINLQQVKGSGFTRAESGEVRMDDFTRKEVLRTYQERKREEIRHPYLGEKVEVGLLPHCQAMLLARHLRGDIDGYPPFFWK
jgi:CRISPR-associated protein Cas1